MSGSDAHFFHIHQTCITSVYLYYYFILFFYRSSTYCFIFQIMEAVRLLIQASVGDSYISNDTWIFDWDLKSSVVSCNAHSLMHCLYNANACPRGSVRLTKNWKQWRQPSHSSLFLPCRSLPELPMFSCSWFWLPSPKWQSLRTAQLGLLGSVLVLPTSFLALTQLLRVPSAAMLFMESTTPASAAHWA